MARAPLGEVCVELKLMTPLEVEKVLRRLRAGDDLRFGEIAMRLGFLDELAIARAIAHQFRLQVVSEERLARLTVPPSTLELLSSELIRTGHVVPTYYDPERKILSLITPDPTNVPALRQAQEQAGAETMRLFVGPDSAITKLIERLLPEESAEDDTDELVGDEPTDHSKAILPQRLGGRVIILEPDLQVLGALRELENVEQARAEFAHDTKQVAVLLETEEFDRVFYRAEHRSQAESYKAGWRRIRPGLLVTEVEGWGPSRRPTVPFRAAGDFYQHLVEFLLLASENKNMAVRARVRRTVQLVRLVATELRLHPEQRDTLIICALFGELEEMSVVQGLVADDTTNRRSVRRFELALALLGPMSPPFDLDGLFTCLEQRVTGTSEQTGHQGAEILYTVREIVSAGATAESNASRILGEKAASHDSEVLEAVSAVLRREALRGRLAEVEEAALGTRTIVVAERDGALTTAIETRIGRLGYEVVLAPDGVAALERVRTLVPAALIANLRLPKKDGLTLLLDLKRDDLTKDVPVLLLSNRANSLDVARGIELGAEDVLEKPINLNVLVARLKRAVARNGTASAASMNGQLADLSLQDLIQTLSMAGKTAKISLVGPDGNGSLNLVDGGIVHASWEDQRGEDALVDLFGMTKGRFEVQLDEKPEGTNIQGDTNFLMLEATRRLDEKQRGS